MTFAMLLRTLFEVLMFVAVVWCVFHEDRLDAFEKRVFCAVRRRRLKVATPRPTQSQLRILRENSR